MHKLELVLFYEMEKTLNNINRIIETDKMVEVDLKHTFNRIEYELQGYHLARAEHIKKVEEELSVKRKPENKTD